MSDKLKKIIKEGILETLKKLPVSEKEELLKLLRDEEGKNAVISAILSATIPSQETSRKFSTVNIRRPQLKYLENDELFDQLRNDPELAKLDILHTRYPKYTSKLLGSLLNGKDTAKAEFVNLTTQHIQNSPPKEKGGSLRILYNSIYSLREKGVLDTNSANNLLELIKDKKLLENLLKLKRR